MPLKNSCSNHAWWLKSSLKYSIRFCGIFLSLKHNFIAYRSFSRPDCIFEILWQSSFSGVYSNCCCSCSFEREIIKIGQSSHKMYSNKILNFQVSMTILNCHKKKVCKLIVCTSYILYSWHFLKLIFFSTKNSYDLIFLSEHRTIKTDININRHYLLLKSNWKLVDGLKMYLGHTTLS